MTHAEKVQLMREHLGSLGISESEFAPPFYRLLWRMGIEATPPMFASFGTIAALQGVVFGVAWGLIMWFAFLSRQASASPGLAVAVSALAGVLFGLIMAGFVRYRARKFGLPPWDRYDGKSKP